MRVTPQGPKVKMMLFRTRHKGWGVRSLERIACGTFVCQYAGELITIDTMRTRMLHYDKVCGRCDVN